MFEGMLDKVFIISDKIFIWIFGIFLNPQQHEIQKLIWSVIASVVVVFIVDFLRKPQLKFFNKNLITESYRWKHGKLWKLKILLKNNLFGCSINNLKVFYVIYDNKLIQKVKLQVLSDGNPTPYDVGHKSDCYKGLNFARGESNNFYLIIRTNNKKHYTGTGKIEIPPDYWYLPSYDSFINFKNKKNSSEPSNNNEFVLNDESFFVRIKILSDQLVSEYLFKLILKNENAFLVKLNFIEKIKIYKNNICQILKETRKSSMF